MGQTLIIIDSEGNELRVPRGDMSDESWDRLRSRVEKSSNSKGVVESDTSTADTEGPEAAIAAAQKPENDTSFPEDVKGPAEAVRLAQAKGSEPKSPDTSFPEDVKGPEEAVRLAQARSSESKSPDTSFPEDVTGPAGAMAKAGVKERAARAFRLPVEKIEIGPDTVGTTLPTQELGNINDSMTMQEKEKLVKEGLALSKAKAYLADQEYKRLNPSATQTGREEQARLEKEHQDGVDIEKAVKKGEEYIQRHDGKKRPAAMLAPGAPKSTLNPDGSVDSNLDELTTQQSGGPMKIGKPSDQTETSKQAVDAKTQELNDIAHGSAPEASAGGGGTRGGSMAGFVRDALLAATQNQGGQDTSFPEDVTGPMGAAHKAGVPTPMSLPPETVQVDLRPDQGGGSGGGAGGGGELPTYNDGSSPMGGTAGEPPVVRAQPAPVNIYPGNTPSQALVQPPAAAPSAGPVTPPPGAPPGAIGIDHAGGYVHPGEVKPENLTPRYEEIMKAAREAEIGKGSAAAEGARQQGAVIAAQQEQFAAVQKLHLQSQSERMRLQQKAMDDYNAVRQEMSAPAGQVDPERWWNSRNVFQKVCFVIASAFNPNFPSMVQGLIRADIDAQKANFEMGERRLEKRLGAANTAYESLRQLGADETTATHQATALLQEQLKARLEVIAANTNSQVVKADAQLKLATLDKGVLDSMQATQNHTDAMASAADQKRWERYKFSVTHPAGGVVKAGVQLKPSQAESMANFKSALDLTDELTGQFTGKGTMARLWEKATKDWTKSEANNYEAKRAAFLRTIGLITDQSVLQKHDIEEWDRLLPHAGDLNGEAKLSALAKSLRTKYSTRLDIFQKAGFNVSGFTGSQQPSAPEPNQLDIGVPVEE